MPSKKVKKRGLAAGDTSRDVLERDIIARYAAKDDSGQKNRYCGPRADEDPHENWRWAGNDGKPVMRDEQAAKDCAWQLSVAKRQPHHAYRCPRSKSGHWHVAPGRAAGRGGHRDMSRRAAV